MDCIYCKIITGELPSHKIAENEHFLAFLDINPISQGHTLVIPKAHCADFSEMKESLGCRWMSFVKEVMQLVMQGVGADAINIGTNNGAAAGQVVMHQHTHLIPRWKGDNFNSWPGHTATPEELAQVKKKILRG